MTNGLNFKQRLFLVAFTILIGSHVHIFQDEISFHLRQFIEIKYYYEEVNFKINRFGIEFLTQLAISILLGTTLIPIWMKNTIFSKWDRTLLSLFLFIPIAIFCDQSFIGRFMPEAYYLHDLTIGLYFIPLLLVIGLYILPKFITLSEYKPTKAFKGGILSCALALPFTWLYDTLFNHFPFFLSANDEWLQNQPEENYIYYFIGYLIGHYSTFETYIGSTGLIWHCIWFIVSGISAWFSYLVIYQSNLKNWQEEATVFE
ncbi:hypothetical protein [Kiloniella majae]|uniref:hypothetical protein n=1 Tax=Kiloniella majae TaxID=1938558 RepID=UPI000A277E68|nr:hypothetical protein [Kiloniella majae]